MKNLFWKSKLVVVTLISLNTLPAYAGLELVCDGYRQQTNNRPVTVDCKNRKAVIDILGAAWKELRNNGIGGSLENMCWDSYQDAKKLHPAIGMDPGIASTFLMRCNMGLGYIQN